MLLIVGLGNPGAQYTQNRHNIGFMAVDEIHRRNASFSPWSKKFQAEISDGIINDEKILLIKPQTYMNLSGQSVGQAMRFYKLTNADLIVLYDDLDLNEGKARIKTGGGSGGHNGIKSIDVHCGNDYRRVRLGIGHPGAKELVHNYVLGNFALSDQKWLSSLLDAIGDNVSLLAKNEGANFMNKVALAVKGEQPEKARPKKPKKQSPLGQQSAKTIEDYEAQQPAVKDEPAASSLGSKTISKPSSNSMAETLKNFFSKK